MNAVVYERTKLQPDIVISQRRARVIKKRRFCRGK